MKFQVKLNLASDSCSYINDRNDPINRIWAPIKRSPHSLDQDDLNCGDEVSCQILNCNILSIGNGGGKKGRKLVETRQSKKKSSHWNIDSTIIQNHDRILNSYYSWWSEIKAWWIFLGYDGCRCLWRSLIGWLILIPCLFQLAFHQSFNLSINKSCLYIIFSWWSSLLCFNCFPLDRLPNESPFRWNFFNIVFWI